jgi:hypothetical protein
MIIGFIVGYSPVAELPTAGGITTASLGTIDIDYTKGSLVLTSGDITEPYYTLILSPTIVFPNYSFDGTNITIPISELPGLSVEEADAVSGNWIDIFQAFCRADHNWSERFNPRTNPNTVSSWNNRNMNAKSSKFRYGVGELNTFLKHFTINYGITHLFPEE